MLSSHTSENKEVAKPRDLIALRNEIDNLNNALRTLTSNFNALIGHIYNDHDIRTYSDAYENPLRFIAGASNAFDMERHCSRKGITHEDRINIENAANATCNEFYRQYGKNLGPDTLEAVVVQRAHRKDPNTSKQYDQHTADLAKCFAPLIEDLNKLVDFCKKSRDASLAEKANNLNIAKKHDRNHFENYLLFISDIKLLVQNNKKLKNIPTTILNQYPIQIGPAQSHQLGAPYVQLVKLTNTYQNDNLSSQEYALANKLATALDTNSFRNSTYQKINDFAIILNDITRTQAPQTKTWRDYLKKVIDVISNVLSLVTLVPGLIRAGISSHKYHTWKFWKPKQERFNNAVDAEIKNIRLQQMLGN